MRRLLLLLLLSVLIAPADAADGRHAFVLQGALPYRAADGGADHHDLELELVREGGVWQGTVLARDPMRPEHVHAGTATFQADGDRLTVEVELAVLDHEHRQRAAGGEARYHLELSADGAGWSGTYRGATRRLLPPWLAERLRQARDPRLHPWQRDELLAEPEGLMTMEEVTGTVQGPAPSPLPARLANHRPPAPGEHPRLFFCREDLSRLRRIMATPFGQKLMAQLHDGLRWAEARGIGYPRFGYSQGNIAAGYGFLHLLDGDPGHLAHATEAATQAMLGATAAGQERGGYATKLSGMALAYDLLYDAWDPAFRAVVQCYLERSARQICTMTTGASPLGWGDGLIFADAWRGGAVFPWEREVVDYWLPQFRGAAGLAALAILGDPPAHELSRPLPPSAAPLLEPLAEEPRPDVPVVPFTDGVMPVRWLFNGPFIGHVDHLAPIGGCAGVRPYPGLTVASGGEELEFRHILTGGDDYSPPQFALALWRHLSHNRTLGGFPTGKRVIERLVTDRLRDRIRCYAWTVIDNDVPRCVQARPNWGSYSIDTRMWLAGRELRDGDCVRLAPGRYPLLIEMGTPPAYRYLRPHLVEHGEAEHRRDLAAWEAGRAALTEAAGGIPGAPRWAATAASDCLRFVAAGGFGECGWGTGNSGMPEAASFTLLFCQAYRKVLGIDLVGDGPASRFATCWMWTRHFHQRGQGTGPDGPWLPLGTPFLPADQRAVARWRMERIGLALNEPSDVILALAAFPDEVPARAPDEVLPLHWQDPRVGADAFRSGWDPQRTAVLTVNRAAWPPQAAAQAGNVNLHALDWPWLPLVPAWGQGIWYWPSRLLQNQVLIDGLYNQEPAELLHRVVRADGSATVSLRIAGFRQGEWYLNQAGKRRLRLDEDSRPGVEQIRAIAADWSGASGASALIVVADRLRGAGKLEVAWQYVPRGAVEIVDGGFIVRPPGDATTSLRATFVAPRPLQVWHQRFPEAVVLASARGPETWKDRLRALAEDELIRSTLENSEVREMLADLPEDLRPPPDEDAPPSEVGGHRWRPPEPGAAPRQRIAADDSDEVVFTVMTVQEGEPPAVVREGEGADLRLRIGGQTVSFDGERLHLER